MLDTGIARDEVQHVIESQRALSSCAHLGTKYRSFAMTMTMDNVSEFCAANYRNPCDIISVMATEHSFAGK